MGGWPDGVDHIIKLKKKVVKLTEEVADELVVEILEHLKNDEPFVSIAEAMCLKQSKVLNLYYCSTHHNVMDNRAKKELKRVQLKEEKQEKKDQKKEAADGRVVEILEHLKNDEPFVSIAEAMCLKQSKVLNLFYCFTHPNVLDYRENIKDLCELLVFTFCFNIG